MAGVGYFLLILGICSFTSPYKIIPALVIALLGTYRGPSILAKLRITTEEARAKAAVAPELLPSSDEPAPAKGCCASLLEGIYRNFSDLKLKRQGVMLVSVRYQLRTASACGRRNNGRCLGCVCSYLLPIVPIPCDID
jgi:hypothetical protein